MANVWDQLHLQAVDRGSVRTQLYQPNRNVDERIYLHGTPEQLQSQVISINANRILLDNRDAGNIDITQDDQPVIKNNGVLVEFVFCNFEEPPYYTSDRRVELVKSAPIVPNFKVSLLSFSDIKAILGKEIIFTDGDVFAVANLESGRKLKCRASTQSEAKSLIKKLELFSEHKIVGNIEYSEFDRDSTNFSRYRPRKKQPMYLAWMYIRNYQRATKYERLGEVEKAKKNITTRLNLYYKQEPSWYRAKIREALSLETK